MEGALIVAKARQSLRAALDERLRVSDLFSKYLIPRHANSLSYCLGGVAFIGALVLGLTGWALAQFFNPVPTAEGAYHSVDFLIREVPFGAFVRNIHYWAAQVAVTVVALHMIRVYVSGAYRRPREAQWVVGVLLFSLTLASFFTGTVLKWDQESVEALAHNTELAGFFGALGTFFTPQFAPHNPLLARMAVAHVSVLPILVFVLIGAHFYLLRRLGISSRSAPPRQEELVPFTTHLKRVGAYALVTLIAILAIAWVAPAPLLPAPIEGVEITRPPWPFLWLFGIEDLFGIAVLAYPPLVLTGLQLLVPVLDRSASPRLRSRWLMLVLLAAALAIWAALTVFAATQPIEAHIAEE